MSALLRALIGWEAPPSKANLATVTDSGIIPLESGDIGIKAKLQQGKTYHVKFSVDYKIETVEPGSKDWARKVRVGNWNFWRSPAAFLTYDRFEAGTKKHFDIDIVSAECFKTDADGLNGEAFQQFVDKCAGTAHYYNLEVYEG